MKNIKNRLWTKRFIGIILVVMIAIGGMGAAFASNLGGFAQKAQAFFSFFSFDKADNAGQIQVVDEEKIKAEKKAKLEEEMKDITLPEEFEAEITQRKDSKKILRNTKIIMAERNLDDQQRAKLEAYMLANADTAAVYTLYDYFFENFFTESDMDAALSRYNGGENLESILKTYVRADDTYMPHDYPEGTLAYLIEEKGVDINELAVLEILSHRGLVDLSAALERLKGGDQMVNICDELKVLNRHCATITVNLSTGEVEAAAKELGVSQDEATKKVMAAKKAKVKDKDIIKHLKSGESKEKTILQHYDEKFDGRAAK